MVEIEKADPLRISRGEPVKLVIIHTLTDMLIKEIDKRPANADDRGGRHDLALPLIGFGPVPNGVIKGMLRIHHPPSHRRGAGTVFFSKTGRMGMRFGIDQIRHIPLLP